MPMATNQPVGVTGDDSWHRYHDLRFQVQKRWGRGWTAHSDITNREEGYLLYRKACEDGHVYRLVVHIKGFPLGVVHTNEWGRETRE